MTGRRFQPWEGGEGQVLFAWEQVRLALAHAALDRAQTDERAAEVSARPAGSPDPEAEVPGPEAEARRWAAEAEAHARAGIGVPGSLGEARHELANCADLFLVLGDACAAAGDAEEARRAWERAAVADGDFQEMRARPYSEKTFFSVLACRRLGREDEASRLVDGLEAYAAELRDRPATIDYFATSLPALLLFTDDVRARRETAALFLAAQVAVLRGHADEARAGLDAVLACDPNHLAARTLANRGAVTPGRW